MSKPAIYVPGLPASHLLDRQTEKKLFLNIPALLSPHRRKEILPRLRGPDDLVQGDNVVAGIPIRRAARVLFLDIAKQADSLYDILKRVKVDPAKFGWDWRRPVYDPSMLAKLQQTIELLHDMNGGQRVVVIAHSTGGLVVRRLLEDNRDNSSFLDRIERVIAFGVPWAGTLRPLRFLAGQEALALGLVNRRKSQELLCHSWSAFDVIPPDPTKTDLTDEANHPLDLVVNAGGQQVSPLIERDWFHPDFQNAMNLRADGADRELGRRTPSFRLPTPGIPVTNVVGWGSETFVQARITGSGPQQEIELVDDKGDDTLDGGDGTVPRVSAAWLRGDGVNTYHVPVGIVPGAKKFPHSVLWRNPGGRNLLRHLVGGKAFEPFLYGAVDDKDFIEGDHVRVRLVALDALGLPLEDAAVTTTDLGGGKAIEEDFDPARRGRHLLRIPRTRIRAVDQNLRRFTIEIRGREGTQGRTRRRSFFVRH